MRNEKTYSNNWLDFITGFRGLDLRYHIAGYFDERPVISICLGWGQVFLRLPFKSGINECETPSFGIYYFGSAFWFCWGMKVYSFYMPYSWDWVRTSALMRNGDWEHETKESKLGYDNEQKFWGDKWKDKLWKEVHPYQYILNDGTIQERVATIGVEEREWRWHWLKWFPFIKKVSKTISVEFNDEVGEKTGSWKGGCLGCGYEILKTETPYQTLRRMEKEREF